MENWNRKIMDIVDNIAAGAFQIMVGAIILISGVFVFTVIGNGLLLLLDNPYKMAFAVIGIILFGFVSYWIGKKENEEYKKI